jgi:AraC-like DNA-binding protein
MNWSLIYLLGAVNSFFLALVVVNSKKSGNRRANRFLGVILFSWSYGFIYTWLIETSLYRSIPHILLVGAPNTFLSGPCLLLYADSLLKRSRSFGKKTAAHFIPFFLHTLFLVPFHLQSAEEKIRYWETGRSFSSVFFYIVYLQIIHLFIYLVITFHRVRRHGTSLPETHSSLERVNLAWLRNVIFLSFAGVLFFGSAAFYFAFRGLDQVYINRVSDVFLFVILHIVGYCGLVQPEIFHGALGFETAPASPPADPRQGKYERSSLTKERAEEIVREVSRHMADTKAYLDNELTLPDLAGELDVSPHHLSQGINQILGMNFFECVNRYRIDHAKALIAETPRDRKISFIGIAFSSGFNSKSTFNALFKQYSGTTPSEFGKSLISRGVPEK